MTKTFQRSGRSRADLVRLFAAVPREDRAIAAKTLGFVREHEAEPEIRAPRVEAGPPFGEKQPFHAPEDVPAVAPIVQTPLWRFEAMHFRYEPEQSEQALEQEEVRGLTPEDMHGPGQALYVTPKMPPLAPWSKLWPRLRQSLQATVPSREPDIVLWVRRLSRGEIVTRIPRLERKAWPARLSIWVDRSRRLVPFWGDQIEVCRRLYKVCNRDGIEVRWLDTLEQASSMMRRGDFLQGLRSNDESPILVLGDLGIFGTDADRVAWRNTGKRLRRLERSLSALVPACPARWTPGMARIWNALSWEQGRLRLGSNNQAWSSRVTELLKIISPAAYVQPGLLRALRLLLPPHRVDASTEADVWNHGDVRAADASALVLQPEAAKHWRRLFAQELDAGLQARVSRTIAQWHGALPKELLRAETLTWLSVAPNVAAPGDVQDALDFAARLEGSAMATGDDPRRADIVKRYGHALLAAMPAEIYQRIPALQTVWVASFQGVAAPNGIDPSVIRAKLEKPGEIRHWYVRQVGSHWVFGLNERGTEWPSYIEGPGSPLAWFEASRPWVTIVRGQTVEEHRLEPGLTLSFDLDEPVEIRTDRCTVRLVPWVRESWTIAAGRDRFGLWADASIHGVVQRFRWIPPGRFLMGSPATEEGRFDNEGPQHWVTWTGGRWFGDTPVTQGLWKAVTGNNPSFFESGAGETGDRPVEQVNWNDSVAFADMLMGLQARLPREAEWEYACRAGTITATWLGNVEYATKYHAPLVDSIAWYVNNCGIKSDLIEQEPIGSGQQSYDNMGGATQPVKLKKPNPFGLFDMLGNVYEWVYDIYEDYRQRSDPNWFETPIARILRVLRGGSWGSYPRFIRSAHRRAYGPELQLDGVGFRFIVEPPVSVKDKP